MLFIIRRYFDSIYNILIPLVGFVGSIVSIFASSSLKQRLPALAPLIDKLILYKPIILIVCAAAVFILPVLRLLLSVQKTIDKLNAELKKEQEKNNIIGENIKNTFDGYLYHLAIGRLGFSPDKERVTLYLHTDDNKFIPFGRYSSNPTYRSSGRPEFPDNQGVISLGWQRGWYFDCNA